MPLSAQAAAQRRAQGVQPVTRMTLSPLPAMPCPAHPIPNDSRVSALSQPRVLMPFPTLCRYQTSVAGCFEALRFRVTGDFLTFWKTSLAYRIKVKIFSCGGLSMNLRKFGSRSKLS